MHNRNKALSLLGMCRKAGKLSCGHDASLSSIKNNSAKLCLLSSDSSERLNEEIKRELDFNNLKIETVLSEYTMNEIGYATGLKSAVVTVNDEGFAKAILRELGG